MVAEGANRLSTPISNQIYLSAAFSQRERMVLHPWTAPQVAKHHYSDTPHAVGIQLGICQSSNINRYLDRCLNHLHHQ